MTLEGTVNMLLRKCEKKDEDSKMYQTLSGTITSHISNITINNRIPPKWNFQFPKID